MKTRKPSVITDGGNQAVGFPAQGNRMGKKRWTEGTEDARGQEKPVLTLNQSSPPAVKDKMDYRTTQRGIMMTQKIQL